MPPTPPISPRSDTGLLERLLPYVGSYERLLQRIDELADALVPHDMGMTARVRAGDPAQLEIYARHGVDLNGDGIPDLLTSTDLLDPWDPQAPVVVIDDLKAAPFKTAPFLQTRARSLLLLPLPSHEGTTALLVLGSRQPGAFSKLKPDEIESFRHTLAGPLLVADEFGRQEELTNSALGLAQELWQLVRQNNGYHQALALLLERAIQFSGAVAGSLLLVAPESQELYEQATEGITDKAGVEAQVPWGSKKVEELPQASLALGLLDPTLADNSAFRQFGALNDFSTYCFLPLRLAGEEDTLGIINLYWHTSLVELTPQVRRLLETLAHAGAEVLEYSRTRAALATSRLVIEQLDRHKALFVSLIGHQVRTPLTSLKGFSQLMMRRAKNNQPIGDARHAQTMLTEANRLAVMIDNVLDLLRLERTLLELDRRPFDAMALLADLRNDPLVSSLVEHKVINWKLPAWLPNPLGDALRVRQALIALIKRSRSRSPEDGVITLAARVVEEDGAQDPAYVELEVSGGELAADLGEGDPLKRIDIRSAIEQQAAMQDELALYSAVLIVQAMGGTLLLGSDEGGSVTYRIRLPVAEARE